MANSNSFLSAAGHNINVIIRPHVTEKATMLGAKNQYVFKVHRLATKTQIKTVIEKEFMVKVKTVGVVNMDGKERRYGAVTGRRRDWKKAYITLMEGHSITLPESETVKD